MRFLIGSLTRKTGKTTRKQERLPESLKFDRLILALKVTRGDATFARSMRVYRCEHAQ